MNFKHPRLVRVRWKNRRTGLVRSFVAGVCARDNEHAYDIAECIVGCMIVQSLPLNLAYETAILSRTATQQDMHSPETVWERFEAYQLNMPAKVRAIAGRKQ